MSDRTFRLILDGKKGGLVKGSSPSSAAKKACKKLSAETGKTGKTSFKFELQETTKDSKKKVYGPYKGCFVKDKIKVKMVGGMHDPQKLGNSAHQPRLVRTLISQINDILWDLQTPLSIKYGRNSVDIFNQVRKTVLQSFASNPELFNHNNLHDIINKFVESAVSHITNSKTARYSRYSSAAIASNNIREARATYAAKAAKAAIDSRAIKAAIGFQNRELFNSTNLIHALDQTRKNQAAARDASSFITFGENTK